MNIHLVTKYMTLQDHITTVCPSLLLKLSLFTYLTRALRFTEESIPPVEIQPLINPLHQIIMKLPYANVL